MGSGSLEIWVLWTSFQKSNIGWPQQPLIERVLKFDMNFHDSTKTFFFQNIKVKPNSRTWMTLKSSVVIFQVHSMSSSCRTSTKEIWAAFSWQTFRAKSEWFWAASPTAIVQVNTKKVKLNILSLIFSSWNSLYTKNKDYQT